MEMDLSAFARKEVAGGVVEEQLQTKGCHANLLVDPL